MSGRSPSAKVGFATFFALWADEQRWDVPDVHWRAVHWMEHRADLAVLMCFRGFGKSTLLAVYNAWRYYCDPTYRILHQGDQDKTAYKTSRDTRSVLMRHPLTRDDVRLAIRGEQSFWWVSGNPDERNPSMQAAGITSNITSSRCEEAQNDDVEVPRNIQNPEAREKMRYRLGEQTHCMVPGARQLFIGTPHTHDSLYDEQVAAGADLLRIPMFDHEHRIECAERVDYELPFVPEMVFSGIGKSTRVLREGFDFKIKGRRITLSKATGAVIDCYSGLAWPERFTPDELAKRRKKCRTLNEWDSQYQLHSKPLHQVRLDPDRMTPYEVEPEVRRSHDGVALYLGHARMVSVACRWDPSSGKVNSDVSSLAVVFQDAAGRRYWHRDIKLIGNIADYDDAGRNIIGGQVLQIVETVRELHLPRVTVETNGIGKFAPAVLRAAFKQAKLACAVVEDSEQKNKNKRILEAVEPVITSNMLWAHVSVIEGDAPEIMRAWNPQVTDQVDDPIDALAGAINEAPERLNAATFGKIFQGTRPENWRPESGVFDVSLEDA